MNTNEQHIKTRSGLPVSEALESIHYFIATGESDSAIDLAYDLYRTSSYLLLCVWEELEKIAVCEIGMGEPYALSYVMQMRDICYDCENYAPESGGMQALSFIHAIRYLSECKRVPVAAKALHHLNAEYSNGMYAILPEFAYDHHNHAGRALGHTPLDFLNPDGGSLVIPEAPGAQPYKERLQALLTPLYGGANPQPFIQTAYNHYYEMESVTGLNLEVLQSAFQKSIRRNLREEALKLTYDAFLSGGEMEEYLWQRIVIMSVEDIGMGDPYCGRLMYDYYRSKDHFQADEETRLLFLLQAVSYLCGCEKERGTELRKGVLVQEYKNGKIPRLAPK